MKKSKLMLTIEVKYGINIEELLRRLYVDENKTYHQITKELCISYVTVKCWLHLAGIYSKRLHIGDDM